MIRCLAPVLRATALRAMGLCALGLGALGLATTPAVAQSDLTAMTEAERAAFGEAVRDYLLDNPGVLMEAIAILEQREQAAQAQGDAALVAENAEALFRDPASWVGGNPAGDVTVVEFLDYRCGYCRRAHPEVAELIESDGNIRLIVKEFPILGPQSVLASRYAIATQRALGAEAYEAAGEALMDMRADVTSDSLAALSEELGHDHQAILAEMETPEINERISRTHALGRSLGVQGTPSFVFGDQMVRGYVPLDAMRQIVSEERG